MTVTPSQSPSAHSAGSLDDLEQLGTFIRERREALGISQRELARRAGVADLTRLEQGQIASPRTDTLTAIARALGLSLSELVAMGQPQALPSFAPYLRTKYGDMPEAAVQDLQNYFTKLAKKHGLNPDQMQGPKPGEDEQ